MTKIQIIHQALKKMGSELPTTQFCCAGHTLENPQNSNEQWSTFTGLSISPVILLNTLSYILDKHIVKPWLIYWRPQVAAGYQRLEWVCVCTSVMHMRFRQP